jgi:hypothetical protein
MVSSSPTQPSGDQIQSKISATTPKVAMNG